MKKIAFYALVTAYILAGFNHFINPAFYTPFFPPYLQEWTNQLNILAGVAEVFLAILLLLPSTRNIRVCFGLLMMVVC